MTNLFGTYECKVDSKGRLLLPATLKKQLEPYLEGGFILKKSVFEQCLELYTMEEWGAVMSKVNKLNRFNKKVATFVRRFTSGVKPIDLDGTGRMLIAKELVGFAEIKKEIVLTVTINNIIEIWDKDKYEDVVNNSEDDFGDLAEEVMGHLDEPIV